MSEGFDVDDVTYSVTNSVVAIDSTLVRIFRYRRDLRTSGEPTFVLVHGIGVSSRYFEDLARHLVTVGDVITLDLPGFGRTPKSPQTLSIAGFAAIVHAAIRYEGIEDPIVIGHSMGAQVVTELAARDPKMVRRLLLIGPPVNAMERSFPVVSWRFLQSSFHEPLGVALFAASAYAHCGITWFLRHVPGMVSYPIASRLEATKARVTLVRGEFDYIAPMRWLEDLRNCAEDASGVIAQVIEVSDGAHSVIVKHADTIARLAIELAREEPLASLASHQPLTSALAATPTTASSSSQSPSPEVPTGERPARVRPSLPRRASITIRDWMTAGALNVEYRLAPRLRQLGSRISTRVATRAATRVGTRAHATVEPTDSPRDGDHAAPLDAEHSPAPASHRPIALLLPGVYESHRMLNRWTRALDADGWDVRFAPDCDPMFGPVPLLARRVERVLMDSDATDVVIVAHSKSGLVGKYVMCGSQGWRIRSMVAVGTPWEGSSLARLTPTILQLRDLVPGDPVINQLSQRVDVNHRITSIHGRWDPSVPSGSWLDGAEVVTIDTDGHNRLLTSPVAIDAIVQTMRQHRSA